MLWKKKRKGTSNTFAGRGCYWNGTGEAGNLHSNEKEKTKREKRKEITYDQVHHFRK